MILAGYAAKARKRLAVMGNKQISSSFLFFAGTARGKAKLAAQLSPCGRRMIFTSLAAQAVT